MPNTMIITDCTLWLNGKNFIGRMNEYETPEINNLTADVNSTDSIGTIAQNILKVDKITSKATLNSFYKDAFEGIANPASELNFAIYGNAMEFNNGQLEKNISVRLISRATVPKFKLLPDFKAQEKSTWPIEFNHSMAALYYDGIEKYYIDIPNRIWRIDGVDLLAEINKNLGIT